MVENGQKIYFDHFLGVCRTALKIAKPCYGWEVPGNCLYIEPVAECCVFIATQNNLIIKGPIIKWHMAVKITCSLLYYEDFFK